jgi:hypothetical protein
MTKVSLLVTVQDGEPSCEVLSTNADDALQAYKESGKEAYLFIRPVPAKSKRALKAAPVAKKAAKRGRPAKS